MTVGISNYQPSPLSEVSDVFFCLSFAESRVRAAALSSRAGQVCLIDALYLLVARHMKEPASTDDVDEMVETRFRLPARGGAGTRRKGKQGKAT
jgi:DNA-binding MurR/RpiR family transcriptional regulator